MIRKSILAIAWLALAVSLVTVAVHAQNGPVPPAVDAPPVSGGLQVESTPVHPSDAFLADVDAYIALVGQVQALQAKVKATKEWRAFQDASDRAAGMQARIQQQVPRGWRYDSKSRMFLPPDPPAKRPVPAGRVSPESKEETKP